MNIFTAAPLLEVSPMYLPADADLHSRVNGIFGSPRAEQWSEAERRRKDKGDRHDTHQGDRRPRRGRLLVHVHGRGHAHYRERDEGPPTSNGEACPRDPRSPPPHPNTNGDHCRDNNAEILESNRPVDGWSGKVVRARRPRTHRVSESRQIAADHQERAERNEEGASNAVRSPP